MTSGMTTLKVRTATRDLITKAARAHGKTVDEYLTLLQQEQSWRERIATAGAAMAEPDREYLDEVAAWDRLAGDNE
jgi:hypothetical protein